MNIVTWNVRRGGHDVKKLVNYIDEIEPSWDFLCLQEAVYGPPRQVQIGNGCHMIYSGGSCGSMWATAVIANSRWGRGIASVHAATRHVVLTMKAGFAVASVHCPHRGLKGSEFSACLDGLEASLEQSRKVVHGRNRIFLWF